jgi:hypothetical protein
VFCTQAQDPPREVQEEERGREARQALPVGFSGKSGEADFPGEAGGSPGLLRFQFRVSFYQKQNVESATCAWFLMLGVVSDQVGEFIGRREAGSASAPPDFGEGKPDREAARQQRPVQVHRDPGNRVLKDSFVVPAAKGGSGAAEVRIARFAVSFRLEEKRSALEIGFVNQEIEVAGEAMRRVSVDGLGEGRAFECNNAYVRRCEQRKQFLQFDRHDEMPLRTFGQSGCQETASVGRKVRAGRVQTVGGKCSQTLVAGIFEEARPVADVVGRGANGAA